MNKTVHHGRNVKRFREMLGIKPESLAHSIGADWTKDKISLLEKKETIDDELLSQIASALKVPAESIKNYDDEKSVVNIQNNSEGSNKGVSVVSVETQNNNCNFNSIEETLKELEKYQVRHAALLHEKDARIAELEKLLAEKGK